MNVTLDDLTIPAPPPGPADWNDDGFVIKKKFLPEELMQSYENCWLEHNANRKTGWDYCTPYRDHPEVLEILSYKGIHDTIEGLIGEPGGVHLNLTGWVSTTRNWHQDTYLNPPHVGDYYVAVWIALETINSWVYIAKRIDRRHGILNFPCISHRHQFTYLHKFPRMGSRSCERS